MIGILFLGLGILIISVTAKGGAINDKIGYFLGGYFSVFGIIFLIGTITENDKLIELVICYGIGLIFIGHFIYECYCVQRCRVKVRAKYIHAASYKNRFAPIFTYQFKGKKYKMQSPQTVSKRVLKKKFHVGEEYTIFISEKNPAIVLIHKRVPLLSCWNGIFGILMLLIPSGII